MALGEFLCAWVHACVHTHPWVGGWGAWGSSWPFPPLFSPFNSNTPQQCWPWACRIHRCPGSRVSPDRKGAVRRRVGKRWGVARILDDWDVRSWLFRYFPRLSVHRPGVFSRPHVRSHRRTPCPVLVPPCTSILTACPSPCGAAGGGVVLNMHKFILVLRATNCDWNIPLWMEVPGRRGLSKARV